jgi:peptidyl-prolyl cis-trans isomerase SurA
MLSRRLLLTRTMKRPYWIPVFMLLPALAAQVQSSVPAPAMKPSHAVTASRSGSAARVVARVNGAALTETDLQREMLAMFPYARQHGGKIPPSMEVTVRRGAMQMIEFEELVYQEALRRKMEISPARLHHAMADFRAQFDSEAHYQAFLDAELQGSLENLRKSIRRSLLIDDLLDREITRKSAVSDGEVRSYYEKNQAEFHLPAKASIQTISIVISDDAAANDEAVSRRRAEDVWKQAKATKSFDEFGALAEKVSEDDWRVMMGNHGAIEEAKMPPPVAKVAFLMAPGEVSNLIQAENSFCIVRLNGREAARQVPFEQVRAQIRKNLQARRTDQLRAALNRQLRKTAIVEEFS